MKKSQDEISLEDIPMEALILQCKTEKYKLSYAAIRWAKEIKQKESLPETIPQLVPRALREILGGKVTLKEIEKLPMVVKLAPPPAQPATPTLTLNVSQADADSPKNE